MRSTSGRVNEIAALKEGLEPTVIDSVRHRQPVNGLSERDAAVIEFGRELFAQARREPRRPTRVP